MFMITRRYITSKYANDLILWINPAHINFYVGGNVPMMDKINDLTEKKPRIKLISQRFVFHLGPFAIPAKYYNDPKPVVKMDKYKKIKNFIDNKSNFKKSLWYKKIYNQIHLNGIGRYKNFEFRTVEELDDFFQHYIIDMIDSMQKNGYDLGKGKQVGNIMIGEDGFIHKSNAADHRLFIAKLIGVETMPFKVKGVHKNWLMNESISNNKRGVPKLLKSLKDVEKRYQ